MVTLSTAVASTMNLNDPFGRMENRREQDYQSLRKSLQSAGISNRAQALELIVKLRKRALYGLILVLPTTLVLALLLPELRVFSLAFGGLVAVWLVNTGRRGSQFIERYLKEELSEHGDSAGF